MQMVKNSNNQIFCKYTKPILKVCLYLLTLPWQSHIRQLNCQKNKVCVVNLLAATFGDQRIEGFGEKGE